MGTLVKTSFTQRTPQYVGQHREFVGKLALSGSYATGGDTITAATLGLQKILFVQVSSAGGDTVEAVIAADGHSFKLKVSTASATEVANATDLSALSVFARVIGY